MSDLGPSFLSLSLCRDWPLRYTAARLVDKLVGVFFFLLVLVIPSPRDGQSLPFVKATRKTKWSFCCASLVAWSINHRTAEGRGSMQIESSACGWIPHEILV